MMNYSSAWLGTIVEVLYLFGSMRYSQFFFRTDKDDGSEELVTGSFEKVNDKWVTTEKRVPLCQYCSKNTHDDLL